MRRLAAALAVLAGFPASAWAVEGGSGAYLLGSHDLTAGFVPPPGTYIFNDFIYIQGNAPALSIGGVVVTKPTIEVWLYKLNATQVFNTEIFGGTPAVNINIPYASASMEFDTTILGREVGPVSDSQDGFGDIVITPLIGWHSGNWNYSGSLSIYAPTGEYSDAVIRPRQGEYDVLSIGKNKWAFDPTFAVTWLDPTIGLEVDGALGITFSTINEATDYQTAPELHFEGAIGQHFKNGATLGLAGYIYQQLADDSGTGAENFKKAIGAKSLQARVFGIGPVLGYNTKVGDVGVTFQANYYHEFAAKRRLESDVFWLTAGVSF